MNAVSNGHTFKNSITEINTSWQTISISNISVKGGKIEIGFLADGAANAFCDVDDVSLIKTR